MLEPSAPLREQLAEARGGPDPGAAMRQVADRVTQSATFVRGAADLSVPLDRVATSLESASAAPEEGLAALVEAALGRPAREVVQSAAFAADVQHLADSIVATTLAGSPDGSAPVLARLARAADVVRRVAAEDPSLKAPGATAEAQQRLVALPDEALPPLPPAAVTTSPPPDPDAVAKAAEQAALVDRATQLVEAMRAVQAVAAEVDPSPQEGTATDGGQPVMRSAVTREPGVAATATLQPGLSRTAVERLPVTARDTLISSAVDPGSTPLPTILDSLHTAISHVTGQISDLSKLVDVLGPFDPVTEPGPHDEGTDPPPAALAGPPTSHGSVQPAGVADLLVVRQHALRYEPGEVAFVENVAPGEKLTRTTRRFESAETITVTETETTQEQERDQQSTERFDLQRESNDVIQSDSTSKAGSLSSTSYGVLVESGGSKEQSQREAETFGRDVTSRAVGRITQRRRTQVTQRTVQSFGERVGHAFDNSAGGAGEIQVYQWLDKVVQTQLYTYGKRVFYDLVVPEPAALFLRALARPAPGAYALVKPAPFTLNPEQLTEFNYMYYVAGYGATGVDPPPVAYKWAEHAFAGTATDAWSADQSQEYLTKAESLDLALPDGYQAIRADICAHDMGDDPTTLDVLVGRQWASVGLGAQVSRTLAGEVGNLPVAMWTARQTVAYAVTVEVLCEPTDSYFDTWRLRTHDAILDAARQRIAEYQDANANLQASLKMQSLGLSAARKRTIEREELQRACLTVLTNQQFDGLAAIEHSPQGYPQPYLPNVTPLGAYVRFLQEAFEWEQMTWLYYPYFWGRKPYWLDKLTLDDADDEFRDFLRAGSARVLVPVRPGFEAAMATFMTNGAIPSPDQLAGVVGKQYVPLIVETLGETMAIDDAAPYGTPWEVRLPTTLVKLRTDKTLPTWQPAVDAGGHAVWTAGPGTPL